MSNLVALLRGINVGGKNKIPMEDLRKIFEGIGCSKARTYIQSGNVVFEASPKLARDAPDLVSKAIRSRFDLNVPVIIRSATDIERIIAGNPYRRRANSAKSVHVVFLEEKPGPKLVKSLDPVRSPPDEFVLRGAEIYLWCPNGVARTKLTTAYFDSTLETTSTMRNWKTVLKLYELLE